VFGSQDKFIGPASVVGEPHVLPPSLDEIDPTSSWQVIAVQAAVG
jgi:hypothetical protein